MIPRDEVIGGPLERVLAGLAGFYGDDDDAGAVPLALRPALPHLGLRSATSASAAADEWEKGRREGEGREGVKEEATSLQRSNRSSEGGGSAGGRRPI